MKTRTDDSAVAPSSKTCSCSPCGGAVGRRDFLKLVSLGAAAGWAASLPVVAGAVEPADWESLVPVDKKLDADWVKSLFERGTKTVYRRQELETIGMPIGGFCTGQLYLGGDGKLWHWDIFNQVIHTGSEHYANPMKPDCPLEQGFGVRIVHGEKTEFRKLDHTGFADIAFRGEYPIGLVELADPALPVAVSLEAFSPFVPLNVDDSSLPATVMHYTVKNVSQDTIDVDLVGWVENAACLYSESNIFGRRRNQVLRKPSLLFLQCGAEPAPDVSTGASARPDVVFEDFQKETYEGWEISGTTFGRGPILKADMPGYQGDVGGPLPRVINSHASADGGPSDKQTGTLTSRPFAIQRRYINFWIGGGSHPGKTCVDLLIDGQVVRSATGAASNPMREEMFDVGLWQGRQAQLRIVDNETGEWGNIGVGQIVFSDTASVPRKFETLADNGTLGLGLIEPAEGDWASSDVGLDRLAETLAARPTDAARQTVADFPKKPVGALARRMSLAPGQSATATFVVAWSFPNLDLGLGLLASRGRYYATRFASAVDAAEYVAVNFDRLADQTRLWRDTWYDSTLPYWLLDRAMANTSTLATSTCHRFSDGRFWGWEGVGSCPGTCTHVWLYAQAVGRLFPELERDLRRRVDFGSAQHRDTGVIEFRGESHGLAVDGQAGCILRAYREHQMSPDDAFLKSLWPQIKLAMECLVREDNGRGLLEGPQHNTLDSDWYGRVAWLSGMYVVAAKACEAMARELGDTAFADQMAAVVARGSASIDRELFDGEYYYQIADPAHRDSVGSYNGCEIDQVLGQSWAYQVGLGRILDAKNVRTALASLWRYNFTPDVGPFREKHKTGRWFAMPGETGVLMCSWPRGDAQRVSKGYDMYFNECMNGFEYQLAGHMINEGMVQQGLAVARSVHDRYHASRRNPWNEVECGDHYARSMASYGVFLAVCGYRHHGPKGFLAFAPRISPEQFRAPFTTAEGWGTFSQKRSEGKQTDRIELRHGRLAVGSLAFGTVDSVKPAEVRVSVNGQHAPATVAVEGNEVRVALQTPTVIEAGGWIEVVVPMV